MRKNLFKVLFVLLLLSMLTLTLTKVKAAGLSFTTTEVLNSAQIAYGINWKKVKATSVNDEGAGGNQVANYVEIRKDAAQIITWAVTNENGIKPSTTLQAAADFEAHYPNYQVVAGINNDYFGSDASTGVFSMRNVSVVDGVVFRDHSSSSNMYGLAFDEENNWQLTNRGGAITITDDYYLDIYDPTGTYVLKTVKVDGFNQDANEGETVVYKGSALSNASGLYKLNLSANSKIENSMYIEGKVSEFDATSLASKEVAIKTLNKEVARLLDYQVKVRIYRTTAGEWEQYKTILGCPAQFLKNGVVQTVQEIGDYGTDHVSSRHPRTSIGFKDDGTIIFMTIDGRQSDKGMDGVSERENAMAMLEIGATNAFNFDGGGSTTFAVLLNGTLTVTNSPSDGGLRSDSTHALAIVPRTNISLELEKNDNNDGTTHVKGHANILLNADLGYSYTQSVLYVDGYSTNQSAEDFEIDLVNGREYTFAVALTKNNQTKVMYSEKVTIEGEEMLAELGEPSLSFVRNPNGGFKVYANFDGDFTKATRATMNYSGSEIRCIKTYNGFSLNITSNTEKEYNFNLTYRYYEGSTVKEGKLENVKYNFTSPQPKDFMASLVEQSDGKYQLTLSYDENGATIKSITILQGADELEYFDEMLIEDGVFSVKVLYNNGLNDLELTISYQELEKDIEEYVEPIIDDPKPIDPEPIDEPGGTVPKPSSGCSFGALSQSIITMLMAASVLGVTLIRKRH